MDSRLVLGVLLLGACKAELADAPDAGGLQPDGNENGVIDAAPDAPAMLGPWGTPQPVPGAATGASEDDAMLSSSRLELYFKRSDAGDNNLYVMTRASQSSAWGAPVALTVLNSSVDEESARLSQDDLTMYFGREGDIYRTTRGAVGMPWTAPVAVASLNTGAYEKWAVVCSSGYAMVSRSVSNRGQDLFEGDITTGANTPVDQLNSTSQEQGTYITNDCLRVYFQSNRGSSFDIYSASRVTMGAAWSNATVIADFNTATDDEEDPWISPDQRTFLYAHDGSGNKDLYISTR